MIQSGNGHVLNHGKLRGNYTGERLKSLRPQTYREVVRLLAEPREHVSIREICRRCRVTDDTVKAIERREAVPIAARKQELMIQATRIAKRAADRVEDQIDDAPLPQAVVTFGVMTDKIVLLNNDLATKIPTSVELNPLARFNHYADSLNIPRPDPSERNYLCNFINRAAEAIEAKASAAQPALPAPQPNSDSGAENGLTAQEETEQKES
jgi:hypothetical protein